MLPLDAPPERLRALHDALARLTDEDPRAFDALFDPARGGGWRYEPAPEHAALFATLREFGLVEGADHVVGRHRVRRTDGRFYVMELGEVDTYHQDVWPETDAMVAALDGVAPGRVADVGTGCGIVAIEAAARGHRVVATDLFGDVLGLARFNAALNGLAGAIDLREGHLFDPLDGDRFDLILTAPHYGRLYDQLRLEVLRAGWRFLAPRGRLALATQLEWEEGAPLGVESLLAPLAARGLATRVRPILADGKRDWFKRANGGVPQVVSRHRFLVTVDAAGPGGLTVELPPDDAPEETFVPLARLLDGGTGASSGGGTAVVSTAADLARLRALLESLGRHDAILDGPLPAALLDACRFGQRPCLGRDGAAGAILHPSGAVRPCAHGGEVARAEHPLSELRARLAELERAAEERRGCPECAARYLCSRCLFPAVLDEKSYCDLIRAEVRRLPLLHRLVDTLALLAREGPPPSPLSIRRWPRTEFTSTDETEPLRRLRVRWNERETWSVNAGGAPHLFWREGEKLCHRAVEPPVAAVGERVADGADEAALALFGRERSFPPWLVRRSLDSLFRVFL